MNEHCRPSPFTDLAAVEAWDAWFRWREQATLHDAAIEDTWLRVARALAATEPAQLAAHWQNRYFEAMAGWRLLPDARLLAGAGTGQCPWRGHGLRATLNIAAFVSPGSACIDTEAVTACAVVAMRMLDDAAMLAQTAPSRRVRIGVMGLADALALLALGYDSDDGRAQAVAILHAIAKGCFRANVELAAERGARAGASRKAMARARWRETPAELLLDASRHGLRYTHTTAITSQPRLALLANDVADAVDPLRGEHVHAIDAVGSLRMLRSSGYAIGLLQQRHGEAPDTVDSLPPAAQVRMRQALSPWLDETIGYPLLLSQHANDAQCAEAHRLALAQGLGAPSWRTATNLQQVEPCAAGH